MQNAKQLEDAFQTIDICEANGLLGTAAALRKILENINQANTIARRTRSDDVTVKQKAE